MSNEFIGLNLECSGSQLIPNGSGYSSDTTHRACTVAGAGVNGYTISGAAYVYEAYDVYRGALWRNFGMLFIYIEPVEDFLTLFRHSVRMVVSFHDNHSFGFGAGQ
jgi:hypothetical protein